MVLHRRRRNRPDRCDEQARRTFRVPIEPLPRPDDSRVGFGAISPVNFFFEPWQRLSRTPTASTASDAEGHAVVTIVNDGLVITAEQAGQVLTPFHRLDAERTAQAPGSA